MGVDGQDRHSVVVLHVRHLEVELNMPDQNEVYLLAEQIVNELTVQSLKPYQTAQENYDYHVYRVMHLLKVFLDEQE